MKSFLHFIFITCFAIFIPKVLWAGGKAINQKQVTIGVYVTSIYDINLEQNYFGVDYWMWLIYRKEYAHSQNFDPATSIKLLNVYNGEALESYNFVDSSLKNDIYIIKKVSAKVRNDFDINDFPFDTQVLKLQFEDTQNEMKYLKFNIEKTAYSQSGIDNNIKINGIDLNSTFRITHSPHQYKNNFGNPKNLKNKDVFDRIVVAIDIERQVGFLFLKMFTGLYVSFLISMLSFLINPKDINTRFSLPVGGLFAAVGNKYFVDGLLPGVNSMTLTDIIHSVTFLFIFIIILFSVINIYLIKGETSAEKNFKVKQLDARALVGITISYIIINAIFIIIATH